MASRTRCSSDSTGRVETAKVATSGYVPPKLVVLGTLVELTQLGTAPTDELLNDGSKP
jgi:hypothetical protein